MIDLTDLLEERSRVAGTPAGERLTAVERRIVRRRRRRRVAGAALGVAVLVAAVTAGLVLPSGARPAHRSAAAAPPSVPASTPVRGVPGRKIGPFAEYAAGYRVVAVASAPVGAGRAATSWTVGSTDVQLFAYCPGLPGKVSALYGDIVVDGASSTSTDCHPELRQDAMPDGWPNVTEALTVGRTATIGFEVTDAQGPGSKRVAAPKQGTIYLAVAERVPFGEFPLPSRPAVVRTPTPDADATDPGGQVLHSDPTDPLRTLSAKVVWRNGYDYNFTIRPGTPGVYTVAIDGVTLGTVETYDYLAGGKGWSCCSAGLPKIAGGRTVTVTFTAQYATGPWLGEISSARINPGGHG